ncbi:MAG: ThiF family adenylyltransferase [Balneola sp.]
MLRALINRSPDLKRLRDEGYKLEPRNGFLLVHRIPYLNSSLEIKEGTLVTDLDLAGDKTVKPKNHVIYFIGDQPCNKDGMPISGIQHNNATRKLVSTITVNRSFSNKPNGGYSDYYDKITRYSDIISAPAISIDPSRTAKVHEVVEVTEEESVFKYIDSNSTRAEIVTISEKLVGQKIGIIGLGGTGSYVLDQVAKTPVLEIHLIDGDHFLQHNAFRAPGAASIEKLRSQPYKTDYYFDIYSKMHRGIKSHPVFIDTLNISMLDELDFVFICIDTGEIKKTIFDYLLGRKIAFIDSGLEVSVAENSLLGTVRTTLVTDQKNDHIPKRVSFASREDEDYKSNIQIADLNALNALMAVFEWKKHLHFYQNLEGEYTTIYSTNMNEIFNEDHKS